MNGNDLIRVISFNLKRDFGLPLNRSHKWSERRALAAQYIRESGATIIGVQELLPNMREDVSRLLDVDYSVLGFGRYSGIRPQSDEHSDIIIKNDSAKVNLIKTFWLSKEPSTSRAPITPSSRASAPSRRSTSRISGVRSASSTLTSTTSAASPARWASASSSAIWSASTRSARYRPC